MVPRPRGSERPPRTGKTAIVSIAITRWSTDQEREALLNTLQECGREKLVTALEKLPPVGTIRTASSIGYDLYYARDHATLLARRACVPRDLRTPDLDRRWLLNQTKTQSLSRSTNDLVETKGGFKCAEEWPRRC